MIHRYMFGISMAFLAICLVITTNAITALFTMLLMGTVPGTSLTMPAGVMLVGYPLIILVVVGWLLKQPLFFSRSQPEKSAARAVAKKPTARRAQTKPRVATTRRRSRATS